MSRNRWPILGWFARATQRFVGIFCPLASFDDLSNARKLAGVFSKLFVEQGIRKEDVVKSILAPAVAEASPSDLARELARVDSFAFRHTLASTLLRSPSGLVFLLDAASEFEPNFETPFARFLAPSSQPTPDVFAAMLTEGKVDQHTVTAAIAARLLTPDQAENLKKIRAGGK